MFESLILFIYLYVDIYRLMLYNYINVNDIMEKVNEAVKINV
jgi:hypothetical protein